MSARSVRKLAHFDFYFLMSKVLPSWIAQEEEHDRLTQEALADVDAGLVIDHTVVQAWADSLGTGEPF